MVLRLFQILNNDTDPLKVWVDFNFGYKKSLGIVCDKRSLLSQDDIDSEHLPDSEAINTFTMEADIVEKVSILK